MAFDPVLRVMFDDDGTSNINNQVSTKIRELEARIPQLRKDKKDPREELRPAIEKLKASISRAHIETVEAIDAEVEELRAEWIRNRDQHPDRELARIRRAENEVAGLSDNEVMELATKYFSEPDFHIDGPELNLIRARLHEMDAAVELEAVGKAATMKRDDAPWVGNAEAMEMLDYRDDLLALPEGSVLYDGDGGKAALRVDDLIDYELELDEAPA